MMLRTGKFTPDLPRGAASQKTAWGRRRLQLLVRPWARERQMIGAPEGYIDVHGEAESDGTQDGPNTEMPGVPSDGQVASKRSPCHQRALRIVIPQELTCAKCSPRTHGRQWHTDPRIAANREEGPEHPVERKQCK